MGNEILPAGVAYMYDLLEKWGDITKMGEECRENMLNGRIDPYSHTRYVSKLTRMWLELYPKVEGRSDFNDISKEYSDFERYYRNPSLFMNPDNAAKMLDLEMLIRRILERLKVTEFERL